ncbi:MAG: hypothetical protein D6790_12490 [Caldilineae bacterium]|nr:MAG: hypothetical protein D6790_12490 [Caldilineae bacterium]
MVLLRLAGIVSAVGIVPVLPVCAALVVVLLRLTGIVSAVGIVPVLPVRAALVVVLLGLAGIVSAVGIVPVLSVRAALVVVLFMVFIRNVGSEFPFVAKNGEYIHTHTGVAHHMH